MTGPARRFTVHGRVQGVFFRDSTRREAQRLGINGHAVNLADGTVEVLAAGPADALAELERWLHQVHHVLAGRQSLSGADPDLGLDDVDAVLTELSRLGPAEILADPKGHEWLESRLQPNCPRLEGKKLLVLQHITPQQKPKDTYVVALDTVGAGVRDKVIAVAGSSARMATGMKETPVDTAIVGIIDEIDLDGGAGS